MRTIQRVTTLLTLALTVCGTQPTAAQAPADSALKKMIEEPRRGRDPFAPDFSFTSRQGEVITRKGPKGKTVE